MEISFVDTVSDQVTIEILIIMKLESFEPSPGIGSHYVGKAVSYNNYFKINFETVSYLVIQI